MTDERNMALSTIFTPSAPVNRSALFRGRIDQVLQVTSALVEPGRHVVLYGERGVGKTSLANLLTEFLSAPMNGGSPETVRFNCSTQDTFRSIWQKAFREMGIKPPPEWADQRMDPDGVRWALAAVRPFRIIVIDEFDRVENDDVLSLMADTIKSLSDHNCRTKLVIVGVADSLNQLIGEHESVQRAVQEVLIPRMELGEALDIIETGLGRLNMTASGTALNRIGRLAEGLPHYVHLLTLHAARNALLGNRDTVEVEDVEYAVGAAVERHSLLREYQVAVDSAYPNNLFSRVLAACALADKNRLGYFTAGAVREPLARIMGKPYAIPAFAPHLKAFTEMERGSVLHKNGTPRHYTYRFRNPLLQPFSILAALAEGSIPEDYRAELLR
jgi:hypothetical protein